MSGLLLVVYGVEIVALCVIVAWQSRLVAQLAQQCTRFALALRDQAVRVDVLEAQLDAQLDADRLGDIWGDDVTDATSDRVVDSSRQQQLEDDD